MGNDELWGDSADFTGQGDDRLFGGDGDDVLNGGYGADYLSGGVGNDQVHGDRGDDTLFGDAGDDWLSHVYAGYDRLDGGRAMMVLASPTPMEIRWKGNRWRRWAGPARADPLR
ncbi:hypothetical protein HED52_15845 [Ochrobactrum ciceri]|uniref:Calcium-binding protein n=1 Tax=Brucella ciceri TaxID=391287 RepID=A0ABX1DZL8_9HYPH|nr:hypothetical protein [Brucella ciceri]